MIRIIIILVLSIISYFGITLIAVNRNPEIKELTMDVPVDPENGTKLHENGIPDQVVGTFELDQQSTAAWLNGLENLTTESKTYFTDLHTSQNKFTFDGKSIWFSNHVTNSPTEILEVGDKFVKLKFKEHPSEHKGSDDFYLQWDDNGYLWYSNYSHLAGGKMQLFRACYKKVEAE